MLKTSILKYKAIYPGRSTPTKKRKKIERKLKKRAICNISEEIFQKSQVDQPTSKRKIKKETKV